MLFEGYDYAIFTFISMILFSLILSSYNRNDTDVPWKTNYKQHNMNVFPGKHINDKFALIRKNLMNLYSPFVFAMLLGPWLHLGI
jgi:membrane glycosyltransferase